MTHSIDLVNGYVSGPMAATEPRRRSLQAVAVAQRIVLVEGITDQIAIERLAARRGIDLAARGAVVAPMGGAHAIGAFLQVIRERNIGPMVLGGLCDEREASVYRDALVDAGFADPRSVSALEQIGFHVCRPDLETELIRALGTSRCAELVADNGDLAPLRTLRKQAPWRDRPADEQLHRFLRSKARRMHTYAAAMVDALADDEVPAPLDHVVRLL